ncbi:MAG: hypothetical protein H0V97_07675 [Actinobacteria bacterium]|nr:hypothetical protein [Actinomycetota bacterium]
MTARGKIARLSVAALTLLALLLGTIVGQDDHFPFGPLRMFSIKNELDGRVRSLEIEGVTESGEVLLVSFEEFGLRRADVEGQLGKLEEAPEDVVEALRRAAERFTPGGPTFVRLRLFERIFVLDNGTPVDQQIETLAVWRSP